MTKCLIKNGRIVMNKKICISLIVFAVLFGIASIAFYYMLSVGLNDHLCRIIFVSLVGCFITPTLFFIEKYKDQ